MITIISKDYQSKKVDEHVLDTLIASNKIFAFYRSFRWVVVGRDPVRERRTFYANDERRRIIYGDDFCMK